MASFSSSALALVVGWNFPTKKQRLKPLLTSRYDCEPPQAAWALHPHMVIPGY
jgi:hypothetical protein